MQSMADPSRHSLLATPGWARLAALIGFDGGGVALAKRRQHKPTRGAEREGVHASGKGGAGRRAGSSGACRNRARLATESGPQWFCNTVLRRTHAMNRSVALRYFLGLACLLGYLASAAMRPSLGQETEGPDDVYTSPGFGWSIAWTSPWH